LLKLIIMSIRREALSWFERNHGRRDAPTFASKFYQAFESWPKKSVWWIQISRRVVEENPSGYINILCQVAPNGNDFHYLKVPARFLYEHLDNFHFVGDTISLYFSTHPKTLFVEERGKGNLDFEQFLVNKVVTQKKEVPEYYKKISPQFSRVNASQVDYASVINKGENPKLEFKATLRADLRTGKPERFIEHSVLKTLGAFLNSDGGTLLIGVEDNRNILGLALDFNSFSKPDKFDEFQKHFDNIIQRSFGNRFQRYLAITFPEVDEKIICAVTITEKSKEPVYLTDDKGQETFYIRRQASTIDLKPSEALKYIKEHWK
jgi:hypothetical protein